MRALVSASLMPFLVAATCSPTPSGGTLASITLDELGPLRFEPTDERLSDTPPTLDVTIQRGSDGESASMFLAMDGALSTGFNLLETGVDLELPPGPCKDTRAVAVRFRLTPGEDWAESVDALYGDVEIELFLFPESSERVETWEGWTLLLTPEITFPTEHIQSDEEPLACAAR